MIKLNKTIASCKKWWGSTQKSCWANSIISIDRVERTQSFCGKQEQWLRRLVQSTASSSAGKEAGLGEPVRSPSHCQGSARREAQARRGQGRKSQLGRRAIAREQRDSNTCDPGKTCAISGKTWALTRKTRDRTWFFRKNTCISKLFDNSRNFLSQLLY